MNTIQFLNLILNWLLADPTHVVAAASLIAAVTPTPNPTSTAGKVYKLLDLLALNFLHAKSTGVELPEVARQVAQILDQRNQAANTIAANATKETQ